MQPSDGINTDAFSMDMKLIAEEMDEKFLQGGYCQDYETFKNIYRYIKRSLLRKHSSNFLILLTLVDEDNNFCPLNIRDELMNRLDDTIRQNLRVGDLYAQYTSCQYLVMLSELSAENAYMVSERILDAFNQGNEMKTVLLRNHYPVLPPEQ